MDLAVVRDRWGGFVVGPRRKNALGARICRGFRVAWRYRKAPPRTSTPIMAAIASAMTSPR
jgi:hypothetical protein